MIGTASEHFKGPVDKFLGALNKTLMFASKMFWIAAVIKFFKKKPRSECFYSLLSTTPACLAKSKKQTLTNQQTIQRIGFYIKKQRWIKQAYELHANGHSRIGLA